MSFLTRAMESRHRTIALLLLVLIFGYVSLKIVSPFFTYGLVGLILAFLCFPIYSLLCKKLPKSAAAAICVIGVFLVVIIPAGWMTSKLIAEASGAYRSLQESGVTLASVADKIPGLEVKDLQSFLFGQSTGFLPRILTVTGEFLVGMLILALIMFYSLTDGERWRDNISGLLPIKSRYKTRLEEEIAQMTRALFVGQALTSILIGATIGFLFWVFGVPNATFWGFVMIIFSFLPVVGAPVVYVPAAIIMFLQGNHISSIVLIILATGILLLAEYWLRPKLVSSTSALHPLTVIVGAIGGVYAIGFIGFLIGPLILGIFLTLLSFDLGQK